MPTTIKQDSQPTSLKFGGGINSRASEEDIDPRECTAGENFALDAGNFQFRPRKPFDLVGTVPNAAEVRGGGSLLKSDGTTKAFIQAGNKVYELSALDAFSEIATVSATAKLRGSLEHQWQLDDKVLITDLNLVDPVKEWNGTTFQDITFQDECDDAFGVFRARYCYVDNERAVFANIHDNGSNFPHLVVGSKRSDFTMITVSNRPSGALSDEDPFFLVQPDNFAINGINSLFGEVVISSNRGSLFRMTGSNAKDFALFILAVRNAADGAEAMTVTANDIVYGRAGAIESVRGTERFGDVEQNDLSRWIRDDIDGFKDWTIIHNRRVERTYCYSNASSAFWVLHHPVLDLFGRSLSPWSKWTTQHAMDFDPTFMMNMLNPADGLEYVFMGDASGNVYRLEGTSGGDGGSANIDANRTSVLFSAAAEGKIYDIQGYARYRKSGAVDLVVTYQFAGEHDFDSTKTIALPSGTGMSRQRFAVEGAGNDIQIKTQVDSTADWTVNEIGFRYSETN